MKVVGEVMIEVTEEMIEEVEVKMIKVNQVVALEEEVKEIVQAVAKTEVEKGKYY
jgi:uracil phosphoribosyltransferase